MRSALFALAIASLLLMSACSGGTSTSPPSSTPSLPAVTVSVAPSAAAIDQGGTVNFGATVAGSSNTGVVWSVQEGAAGGTVTAAGVYTAPFVAVNPPHIATYHVVATSQANSAIVGMGTVTVYDNSLFLQLTVFPSSPALSYQSAVTIIGIAGLPGGDYSCSVQEGPTGGSIIATSQSNATCDYFANAAPGTYHVTVTSSVDPARSRTIAINVQSLSDFDLDPLDDVLPPGGQRTVYARTPNGALSMGVTWRLSGGTLQLSGGGTMGSIASYTAPTTLGTYDVTASIPVPSLSHTAHITVGNSGYFSTGPMLANPGGIRPSLRVTYAIRTRNDTVFLLANCGESGSLGRLCAEVFEPANSAFSVVRGFSLIPAPGPQSSASATLLNDGRILLAGGMPPDTSATVAAAALFDPATNTFTATGSLTISRERHTSVLLANGKVLIVGGDTKASGGTETPTYTAELYDPATGTFTLVGSMLQQRTGFTATLLPNGKVLIAGGQVGGAATLFGSAELFDPSTNSFLTTGSMTVLRGGHTATLQASGKVLIAGGGNTSGPVTSAELYDPVSGTFSATGDLRRARFSSVAVLLMNGKVLVLGGAQRSAELYDPASGSFSSSGGTEFNTGGVLVVLSDGKVLLVSGLETPSEIYHP